MVASFPEKLFDELFGSGNGRDIGVTGLKKEGGGSRDIFRQMALVER